MNPLGIGVGARLLVLWLALSAAAAAQSPPPDRPQPLDSASMACLHRASAPRTARAVATLPDAIRRFQAGLGPGRQFFVTVRLHLGGREEQVFVRVREVKGDTLAGQLDSQTELLTGFRRGQRFLVLKDAVIDWTITQPDGSEEGNVLGKMMDTLQDRLRGKPGATICSVLSPE